MRVASCGKRLLPREGLCGEFVFVQKAAKPVVSANVSLADWGADRDWSGEGRLLLQRAVRSMRVVVRNVFVEYALEVAA